MGLGKKEMTVESLDFSDKFAGLPSKSTITKTSFKSSINDLKTMDEFSVHVDQIIFNKDNFYIVKVSSDAGEVFSIKLNSIGKLVQGLLLICKKGSWTSYKGKPQFDGKMVSIGIPENKFFLATFISEITKIPYINVRGYIDELSKESLLIHNLDQKELIKHGIPKLAASTISSMFTKLSDNDIGTKLQEFGIHDKHIPLVIDYLPKDDSIKTLLSNPYALMDIETIDFAMCDKLAMNFTNIPRNDAKRIGGGMHHILNGHALDGHAYYPANDTVRDAMDLLNINGNDIINAIQKKLTNMVVLENNRLYAKNIHIAETNACKNIAMRAAKGRKKWLDASDKEIVAVGMQMYGFNLTKDQIKAVQDMTCSMFSILVGGAGTGKTVVEGVIVALIKKHGLQVRIMAPTGKAAKRAEEVSGESAETIHRACGFNGCHWLVTKHEPLKTDVVSLDEFSMLTTTLMYRALDATPDKVPFLMFGDPNQLESIGSGKVAEAIDQSDFLNICRLTEIKRTDRLDSGVNKNAYRVLDRKDVVSNKNVTRFIAKTNASMIEQIIASCQRVIDDYDDRGEHLDIINDIQVMVPMNKNDIGIKNLNPLLRKIFNPRAAAIEAQADLDMDQGRDPTYPHDIFLKKNNSFFMRGDKIMKFTDNDIKKSLANGDVGVVINANKSGCTVQIGDRKVELTSKDLTSFDFAYAMTIHKSQGSEYKHVIAAINQSHKFMFSKNLVYTMMTRAKTHLDVIDDGKSLYEAIQTPPRSRHCSFKARLKHEFNMLQKLKLQCQPKLKQNNVSQQPEFCIGL